MRQYNYNYGSNELYHYGVPGMKWGQRRRMRLERRVEKRYSKYGKKAGVADYYKKQGEQVYKKHDANAKVLDKQAKQFESQGRYLRAEAVRKAAAALRSRGANLKAKQDSQAKKYELKAEKLKEKASTYASKKRVDLGKSRLNSIISSSKQKGYDKVARNEERAKEREMEERLGERGYSAYNKVRGK